MYPLSESASGMKSSDPFHLTVLSKEYSRILVFKEPVPSKALNGHLIRAEKVADEGSCRVFCYLEPNCTSINVSPHEDGGRSCELNTKADGSPSLSALRQKNRYTYYGIGLLIKLSRVTSSGPHLLYYANFVPEKNMLKQTLLSNFIAPGSMY